MTELFSPEQRAIFQAISSQAEKLSMRSYVVGGVVRDIFLGQRPLDKDIDFLIEGNALLFAEEFQKLSGGSLKRFDSFYTAKIVRPERFAVIDEIDLASSRTEMYAKPGALPTVALASIEADLQRRDFSINAMAIPVGDLLPQQISAAALRLKVLDRFQGLADLDAKIVRVLHERSFFDDPTRIFRAARYAVRLGGNLESQTAQLVSAAVSADVFGSISEQRKLNELRKVLFEANPLESLRLLAVWGVLEQVDALSGCVKKFLSCWARYQSSSNYRKLEQRAAVFPALCAALQPVEAHSDCLRGFGLSKKLALQFQNLAEASAAHRPLQGDVAAYPDEILLAAGLCEAGDWAALELKRRGLVL